MRFRLPADLSRFLAVLLGLPAVAYVWAVTFSIDRLSLGSSTSSVGYVVGLVYGVIAAGAGLLAGGVVRGVLRSGDRGLTISVPLVAVLVLVVTGGSGWLGHELTRRRARDYQPAVLVDLGRLEDRAKRDTTGEAGMSGSLLGGGGVRDSMTWNGQLVQVHTDTAHLFLDDPATGTLTIPLAGIGKPFRIDVVSPRLDSGPSTALVMMVIGSMRHDRAMLVVVDPAWRLIHQERLLRSWPITLPSLWLWQREEGDLVGIRTVQGVRRIVRVAPPPGVLEPPENR